MSKTAKKIILLFLVSVSIALLMYFFPVILVQLGNVLKTIGFILLFVLGFLIAAVPAFLVPLKCAKDKWYVKLMIYILLGVLVIGANLAIYTMYMGNVPINALVNENNQFGIAMTTYGVYTLLYVISWIGEKLGAKY